MSNGRSAGCRFGIAPRVTPGICLRVDLLRPRTRAMGSLPVHVCKMVPMFIAGGRAMLRPRVRVPSMLHPRARFGIAMDRGANGPVACALTVMSSKLLSLAGFGAPSP